MRLQSPEDLTNGQICCGHGELGGCEPRPFGRERGVGQTQRNARCGLTLLFFSARWHHGMPRILRPQIANVDRKRDRKEPGILD